MAVVDQLPTRPGRQARHGSWECYGDEGCALVVAPAETHGAAVDDLDGWLEELNQLGDPFEEPGEWERLQANLAEADRLAKDCVRRQTPLP